MCQAKKRLLHRYFKRYFDKMLAGLYNMGKGIAPDMKKEKK